MMQLGFDFDRAARDAMIDEADLIPESVFGGGSTVRRDRLVAMLRILNGFLANNRRGECWPSQKTLAIKLGLRTASEPAESDRGVKMVYRILAALQELSLLIVIRKVPSGGAKPVNHYRVVWSELALLNSQRRSKLFGRSSLEQPDFLEKQPDFFDEQPDFFCEQPDNRVRQSIDLSNLKKTTTTKTTKLQATPTPLGTAERVVVVSEDDVQETESGTAATARPPIQTHSGTTAATSVQSSSLVDDIQSCGVVYATAAIKAARSLGFDDDAIRDRIIAFRALPKHEQNPAKLYNWLSKRGSFVACVAPQPAARGGRGDAWSRAEIQRASLRTRIIREGRRAGISEEEIRQRCAMAGVEY